MEKIVNFVFRKSPEKEISELVRRKASDTYERIHAKGGEPPYRLLDASIAICRELEEFDAGIEQPVRLPLTEYKRLKSIEQQVKAFPYFYVERGKFGEIKLKDTFNGKEFGGDGLLVKWVREAEDLTKEE